MDEPKNLSLIDSAGTSGLRTYELALNFFKEIVEAVCDSYRIFKRFFYRTFVWDKMKFSGYVVKQNNRVDMWSLNR